MLAFWQTESLDLLRRFPSECVDGFVTDPPYSSGGAFRGDRVVNDATGKYINSEDRGLYSHDFHGDTRDQRSWTLWCTLWLSEAYRVARTGGVLACFVDWRQLPSLTDAIQAAGWVWRGVAVWDKKSGRPQKGRFRQQAEFVVWGSKGPMPLEGPCLPGVFHHAVPRVKVHPTEKPVALLREVCQIVRPGGVIMDPFAGSGAVGEAALVDGFRFYGCELSTHYAAVSCDRLAKLRACARPPRVHPWDPILVGLEA